MQEYRKYADVFQKEDGKEVKKIKGGGTDCRLSNEEKKIIIRFIYLEDYESSISKISSKN